MIMALEPMTPSRSATRSQPVVSHAVQNEALATADTGPRQLIVVSHESFREFQDLIAQPPRQLPRLRELLR